MNASHKGSAATSLLKAFASSAMQVAYTATVAFQVAAISPQPGLPADVVSDKQLASLVEQFDLSLATVGGLLEVAYESAFHLQGVAWVMAVSK